MSIGPRVLITGAAGNLGEKLRRHLEGRYELRLVDLNPRGDAAIQAADLSVWEERWFEAFADLDAVVHLAADPCAHQTWQQLTAPNLDAMINVFEAAARARVPRLVYASSNHVMGGYKDLPEPSQLTTTLPPLPGAHYTTDGVPRDSTAYGAAKLFGERLGKCYAESYEMSVLAVRIGWVRPGDNLPEELPAGREDWFRLMWLSNRDFYRLMECCLTAELPQRFAVINGMSNNAGMRWDLKHTRLVVGYEPLDGV